MIGAIPKSKPAGLAAAARRAEANSAATPIRSRARGSLAWPVNGQILRAYGEQPSGARNDGLDISAAEGSPVHAVDDGVVRYAGSDLQGYGNMLLIAHADGYTSVYAHNRSLLVGIGATVHRGQPIATVGRPAPWSRRSSTSSSAPAIARSIRSLISSPWLPSSRAWHRPWHRPSAHGERPCGPACCHRLRPVSRPASRSRFAGMRSTTMPMRRRCWSAA